MYCEPNPLYHLQFFLCNIVLVHITYIIKSIAGKEITILIYESLVVTLTLVFFVSEYNFP